MGERGEREVGLRDSGGGVDVGWWYSSQAGRFCSSNGLCPVPGVLFQVLRNSILSLLGSEPAEGGKRVRMDRKRAPMLLLAVSHQASINILIYLLILLMLCNHHFSP